MQPLKLLFIFRQSFFCVRDFLYIYKFLRQNLEVLKWVDKLYFVNQFSKWEFFIIIASNVLLWDIKAKGQYENWYIGVNISFVYIHVVACSCQCITFLLALFERIVTWRSKFFLTSRPISSNITLFLYIIVTELASKWHLVAFL